MLAAAVLACTLSGEPMRPSVLGCAVLAALAWAVGSFVVRYYDPWANRCRVEETAMVSLVVLGTAASLGVLKAAFPRVDELPQAGRFFLLLWAPVLALRMLVFRRLDLREPPLEEVLIVGTSAMPRCTAEDLEDRPRARMKVIGYLRLPAEPPCSSIRGTQFIGDADRLEACLRASPVSEVYIAGNATRDGAAMQAAIHTGERFGVPFALPAYSFRLERARPSAVSAVSDGYLHYLTHAPRPYQRSLKRLFDLFAAACALLVLSPLFAVVAALIKLTSRGPVSGKQERVGLRRRLSVRPGLTCIWQVSGRNQISSKEWRFLDMRRRGRQRGGARQPRGPGRVAAGRAAPLSRVKALLRHLRARP